MMCLGTNEGGETIEVGGRLREGGLVRWGNECGREKG
jgi:hypothetical protein